MRQQLEKAVFIVLLSTLAIVLGLVESLLPIQFLIPGVKLGLANIMVVIALQYLNVLDTLTLILLKTLVTTLIMGTFSMFFYSIVGAILSYFTMLVIIKLFKDNVSLLGISMVGGVMHNVGQLAVAVIILQTLSVGYYVMILLPVGAITGLLIGAVVKTILPRLNELSLFNDLYKGGVV